MQPKEKIIQEIEDLPVDLIEQVLDFVRVLKSADAKERLEMAILSEPALSRDWLSQDEDEAWRSLGSNAEPGQLPNAAAEHDRYLYGKGR
jgi:hypothetical protein